MVTSLVAWTVHRGKHLRPAEQHGAWLCNVCVAPDFCPLGALCEQHHHLDDTPHHRGGQPDVADGGLAPVSFRPPYHHVTHGADAAQCAAGPAGAEEGAAGAADAGLGASARRVPRRAPLAGPPAPPTSALLRRDRPLVREEALPHGSLHGVPDARRCRLPRERDAGPSARAFRCGRGAAQVPGERGDARDTHGRPLGVRGCVVDHVGTLWNLGGRGAVQGPDPGCRGVQAGHVGRADQARGQVRGRVRRTAEPRGPQRAL
mmetsp:Transcript_129312/g.360149  ORF Transcript_129312/g.360149 Transcript_129312/m.360149 type:complete len:261 (+) Transcript_129312:1193-1975(+)